MKKNYLKLLVIIPSLFLASNSFAENKEYFYTIDAKKVVIKKIEYSCKILSGLTLLNGNCKGNVLTAKSGLATIIGECHDGNYSYYTPRGEKKEGKCR